jgi:uncharacterized membrane protein
MSEILAEKLHAQVSPNSEVEGGLLNGHYVAPPTDQDDKTWVRTSVVIQAHAKKLYEMWRNVEAAPAWHERILEVRSTGERTSHWVMKDGHGDKVLEWDFEILAEESEKRIAWRSLSGEPRSAGVVTFGPAPGGRGTMVTLLEQFHTGKFSRLWETITGRDPKQSAIENLRHFKALAETGEIPRTEPQAHGPRGTGARIKRSAYGETIVTPPGSASAEGVIRSRLFAGWESQRSRHTRYKIPKFLTHMMQLSRLLAPRSVGRISIFMTDSFRPWNKAIFSVTSLWGPWKK